MKRILKNKKLKKAATLFTVALMMITSVLTCYAETKSVFSDKEKIDLYAEYVKIAKEVSSESLCPISVVAIEKFDDEDWVSPEQYRDDMEKIVKSLKVKVTVSDQKIDGSSVAGRSSASATKTATATYNGGSLNISVTGSFNTQYSQSLNRQIFSGINSITAVKRSGTGSWKYAGYSRSLIDGGRTYSISIAGDVTIGTNVYSTVAHVSFYCSATGGVR